MYVWQSWRDSANMCVCMYEILARYCAHLLRDAFRADPVDQRPACSAREGIIKGNPSLWTRFFISNLQPRKHDVAEGNSMQAAVRQNASPLVILTLSNQGGQ
jgi:hypothetical protein